MTKNSIVVLLLLYASTGWTQLNNDMLHQSYAVHPQDSNTLWVGVRALGFNKNNEYFNEIADGYTLFGYQVNPYVAYRAGSHVRFDLGVYMQQDFGNRKPTTVLPTFSIKYFDKNHYIIFGSLENAYNHRLIEPLYDFEKGLTDRLEYGLQALFDKEKWNLDTWISWEKMIYPNDPNQEEVIFGLVTNYFLKKNQQRKVSLPLQLIVYHKGGQIDNNPNSLVTTANLAVGMGWQRDYQGKLQTWKMQHYYVVSRDFSNDQSLPFRSGNALYLNTSVALQSGLEFQLAYWHGNGFIPIQGGAIYSSKSSVVGNENHTEIKRNLIILRCFYNKNIGKGLEVSIRFEPNYDFNNKILDFSHGMHLNFTPEFFITKIKRAKH